MAAELDSARLKIVRAQEHLEAFQAEFADFCRHENPYRIESKIDGNTALIYGVVTHDPPARLGCIVGDCLTNIMAGLDHLAWELYAKHGRTGLTNVQRSKITFPVRTKSTPFCELGAVKHLEDPCFIPAAIINEIEVVQTYGATYDFLGFLKVLVNEDKHRTILLCTGFFDRYENATAIYGTSSWRVTGRSAEFNLEAFGHTAPFDQPLSVQMDRQAPALIAFQNPLMPRYPVDVLLAEIIECVANIIPRFEPFF